MKHINDTFPLSNGTKIPCIGYGTWRAEEGEMAVKAVKDAIAAGYTHIDTASLYGNEVSVGQAIKEVGVPREELFVTSKVWNKDRGYEKTLKAFDTTMEKLQLDYLDLYLVHWPANHTQYENPDEVNLDTWKAMIEIYKTGRVKAIGVSNFLPHYLKPLMETEIPPMVNQVEFHPGMMREDILSFCKEHNILVEAWGPLGSGKMLDNETLKAIGEKYGKSSAQVCIKWSLQNGVLPLPKSVTPSRIAANTEVFDFELSKEDMKTINDMPYFGGSGYDPDTVTF